MSKTNYTSQAELIVEVIDIAISCFRNTPPEGWQERQIKHAIEVYLNYKSDVINPQSQYKNLTSLNYIKNDILIYFQEGSGKTVESFWKDIESKNINIRRSNPFEKIIKRGKIKNQIEYDIVIDLFPSYLEKNILSEKETNKINLMITDFEKREGV